MSRHERKAVWIQWSDACTIGSGDWIESLPADTSIVCNTIGILVRKNKTHVVIAHTIDPAGLMQGVFSVPRSAIVRMVTLSD